MSNIAGEEMLRVLVIELHDAIHDECWRSIGIHSVFISPDQGLNIDDEPDVLNAVFDAVAISCTSNSPRGWTKVLFSTIMLTVKLARSIRALPDHVAMPDGKRWRSIPIVLLLDPEIHKHTHEFFSEQIVDMDIVASHATDRYGGNALKKRIVEYRLALLSELDDVGFIVRYEFGRYRVSRAFKASQDLETRYYFGPADRRTGDRLVTVHRENFAIQAEVEAFELLINRPDVQERELQNFFQRHPHFLSVTQELLPQVRLGDCRGRVLVPDFILRPIVVPQRDSRWEVLELKLPQVRLLTGVGSRARFSARVVNAIRQLRHYQEYFSNPAHEREVSAALGHPLKTPRVGILIGRLSNVDVSALEREERYLAGVRLVTYDEILEEQRSLAL